MKGIRVRTEEELDRKMKEFIDYNDGPVLMEALIDEKEHVFPMVVAGAALHDMVTGNAQ